MGTNELLVEYKTLYNNIIICVLYLYISAWCMVKASISSENMNNKQVIEFERIKRTDDHSHNRSLPPFIDVLPPGPFFDTERSANVTALVGRSAKLICRVNKIGNRTVSFII